MDRKSRTHEHRLRPTWQGRIRMNQEKLAELLRQYDDEDLETLMDFVEKLGSFDEARAAIEALDLLRKAA